MRVSGGSARHFGGRQWCALTTFMAYTHVSSLVTRALAFVYLSAFVSAAWLGQWKALDGPHGIIPARLVPELPNPVLEWLGVGERQMDAVVGAGVVLAALVLVFPRHLYALLIPCWLVQLALINTSSTFIRSFGWEWQILETTLPVLLLALAQPPVPVAAWLLRWLACRVMLGAGLSKVVPGRSP